MEDVEVLLLVEYTFGLFWGFTLRRHERGKKKPNSAFSPFTIHIFKNSINFN